MAYYNFTTPLVAGQTVRAAPLNTEFNGIQTAFEKFPPQELSEFGFSSTVFIANGTTVNHAINLGQLQNWPTFGTTIVDIGANRLTNLLDPINPQDAATKSYAQSVAGVDSAANAAISAANALTSEGNAATSETNAAVSAVASASSAAISNTVIPQLGGGNLTALRENEIHDGSTYTLPLANSISANQTITISLPDEFSVFTPTIQRAGTDTITDSVGTDINILLDAGSTTFSLTSDGISDWSL